MKPVIQRKKPAIKKVAFTSAQARRLEDRILSIAAQKTRCEYDNVETPAIKALQAQRQAINERIGKLVSKARTLIRKHNRRISAAADKAIDRAIFGETTNLSAVLSAFKKELNAL